MKPTILKQAIATAILALSATAANAQTTTYNFDYIAQANTSSTLSPGASITSLGGTPVGSITFTDLSDLNLGDGKTGVRISATLNNLSQFGNYSSNTLEFNFPGTGSGTGGVAYINTIDSYRNISNNYTLTTGADGGIEWDEHGSVGNGTVNTASSHKWAFFQQQFNVSLGTWTDGETITFDFLNGDTLNAGANAGSIYNGFSVANLTSVINQGGGQPDAFAWLRVQPTAGAAGAANDPSAWYTPYEVLTGSSAGRINILAVAAVPESDTYAMLLAGLGIMSVMVRRRTAA